MSFLDHVRRCNAWTPSRYRPFLIAGQEVGLLRDDIAGWLNTRGGPFRGAAGGIVLATEPDTRGERSRALRRAAEAMVAARLVRKLRGEDYAVVREWGDEPLAVLDRGAVNAFGVRAFGLHVNGIVRRDSRPALWIGRRAPDKAVDPDKLDNMVAGGQPAGLSLAENLVKEAAEEAAMDAALALRAVPVGTISYRMETETGLRRDTLFVYDLDLPADFVPRNTDGEIVAFALMDAAEVAERVRTGDEFKFNVNLVIIDFLIRHGLLTAADPDFAALSAGLRMPP